MREIWKALREGLVGLGPLIRDGWRLLAERHARGEMIVSIAGFVLLEALTVYLELKVHELWAWGHLLVLPLAMAWMAIGHKASTNTVQHDSLRQLVGSPGAPSAPFIIAQALALHRSFTEAMPPRTRDASIAADLLKAELNPPQEMTVLRDRICPAITNGAVWAICGRKDEITAKRLYDECQHSFHENSNHVERVFFPPNSPSDVTEIRKAIEQHLRVGMTIRAFETRREADQVLHDCHLPRGFGMTWVGKCQRTGGWLAERSPDAFGPDNPPTVFIHWGGLGDTGAHYGVVLKNAAWAQHLWGLYERIRRITKPANVNEAGRVQPGMKWAEFVKRFPIYAEPRTP